MVNDEAGKRIDVPGYQGRGLLLERGERLRVTDVEGCQIGDLFLIAADDPMEVFSPALTRLVNFTPVPVPGQAFISSRRRPMLGFLEDATPGRHDMTFAPCDPQFYRDLGVEGEHPSCRSNFEAAMAALGRDIAVYPDPVNLFQNTPVGGDGNYVLGQTLTRAGDHVLFEALMDLVVVLTACSTDVALDGVYPIGERSTPLRLEVLPPA